MNLLGWFWIMENEAVVFVSTCVFDMVIFDSNSHVIIITQSTNKFPVEILKVSTMQSSPEDPDIYLARLFPSWEDCE